MMSWPILSVVTFLPIVGAIFIAFLHDDEAGVRNARWIALWTTLVTFAVSLILVWRFDPASAEFQFVEKGRWLAGTIAYHMGVDGISLPFVILTTVAVLGTGIMLAVQGPGNGSWGRLHHLSFFLWAAVIVIHLASYVPKLPRMLSGRADHARHLLAARATRWLLLCGSLVAGLGLAFATYHLSVRFGGSGSIFP